jgi:hypothetical protein
MRAGQPCVTLTLLLDECLHESWVVSSADSREKIETWRIAHRTDIIVRSAPEVGGSHEHLRTLMTDSVDLIVAIPVGPSDALANVLDSIESVIRYTGSATKIIVLDDSAQNVGAFLQSRVPCIDVVSTPRNQGLHGGLYLTLSLGYLYAVRRYDFKVLLKLDTDALVIGERPDSDAIEFFAQHPRTGLIGLCGFGTRPDGVDHHWSKSRLLYETQLRRLPRDPLRCLSLRRLIRQAAANGFRPGDYALGGSYFMSSTCIRRMAAAHLLSRREIGRSLLGEDHIFGILAKAVGMDLGDFASGELPMALDYKRLPCAPEQLVARKKKITHSVRRWEHLGEEDIRAFFRARRIA